MSNSRRSQTRINYLRDSNQCGAILIFVAGSLLILLAMIGLAIDLGHAYINKSQLQNIADACALAGASALDNTAAGIQEAENRATDLNSNLSNKYDFNKQPVSIPTSAVSYSAALAGPYIEKASAQAAASTIRFVRVLIPKQPTRVVFAQVIPGISNVMNFGAEAVAGREPLQQVCTGLDPFSARPIFPGEPEYDPSDPFGYTIGQIYSVRLPPGKSGEETGKETGKKTGKNCVDYGLPGSVTGNFGLADPSSRAPSVDVFEDNILNGATGKCTQMTVGSLDATPKDGGKAILGYIQDRFDQDHDSSPYNTYGEYLAGYANNNDITNFRRIVRISFNDGYMPPGSGLYNITGFGCFFMATRPDADPPSSAICFMYIGQCGISGEPTGDTGPSITKLVLFR